ncbi:MAG TPA: hypothetical protein VHV10_00210, partial [Ktedonobacteraceae bacterium]|nr:hypothetical protein [Ktedonobacteraceae bacterium]
MPNKPGKPTEITPQNLMTAAPSLSATPVPQPELANIVEQNVKPMVTDAQRIAAETSVSGRQAVSRGTMFLAF